MIRIWTDGFVPKMDLIELQGSIQLAGNTDKNPDSASSSPSDSHRHAHGEEKEEEAEAVVLGYVEKDHLNPKQRTLRIGTLQVTGARHTFKHPMLVLRARPPPPPAPAAPCSDAFVSDDGHCDKVDKSDVPLASSSSPRETEPILLETWLNAHPEATSLEYLFGGDDRQRDMGGLADSRKRPRETEPGSSVKATDASMDDATRDYELVGWIEDKTVFNSKPARVFV